MSKKKLLILIAIPLVVAELLRILSSFLDTIIGGNAMGLFGNSSSVWFYIIPGGVGLCGLYFYFFIVPLLMKISYIDWRNNNSSWKWELALAVIIFGIASWLNRPLSVAAMITIPLGLAVFLISIVVTLIASARIQMKSWFVVINVLLLTIPIIGYILARIAFVP